MNTEEIDPEVIANEVATRHDLPAVSQTLNDLAPMLDKGIAIIEARAKILDVARKAAIAMTSPEDWMQYRDDKGRTVCYLQDVGCARVRDVFGISIYGIQEPKKEMLGDGSFMYIVRGSGRCQLTGAIAEELEGGRASTDDFITRQKPKPEGVQLELLVRKAARANLDGRVVRELAGLESVPLEEIQQIFKPHPGKTTERFRQGRGFGSKASRYGMDTEADDAGVEEKPVCPKCKGGMKFIQGEKDGREFAFFGCLRGKDQCGGTVQLAAWKKELAQRQQSTGDGHE